MNHHRLNGRLAALGHARQVELVVATDDLGARIDRAASEAWARALEILATVGNAYFAAMAISRLFRDLIPATTQTLGDGFAGLVVDSHRRAAHNLVKALPPGYLVAALGQRGRHALPSIHRPGLFPGPGNTSRQLRDVGSFREAVGTRGPPGEAKRDRILEDFPDDERGLLRLSAAGGELRLEDLLEPARDSVEDQTDLFSRLLFPSPDRLSVYSIVRNVQLDGETWAQRWGKASSRFDLNRLAGIISSGYSQGQNQRQIAQQLLPAVDNVRSAARRIARTYGMALGHATQMHTSQQLGDLVAGYQIHATLDENTRELHRSRNGTIYYFAPGPGQAHMDDCPHPPQEADGSTAFN